MPRGFGIWVAGSAQAGFVDGAAATVAIAKGTYWGSNGPNRGLFGTGGVAISALGAAFEAPGGVTFILGVSAPSLSAGGFVTNAQSSVGHKGLFDNINVSVGWFNGTYSWDPSGPVYQFNFGANPEPAHLAVSRYYTYTVIAPSVGCSGR